MATRSPTPNRDSGSGLRGREDSPSVLPGEVLGGKYRIEARLAEGGMGVVLRATHLDLDCPVAIKVLRPELSSNEDVVARLLAEARIAASLRSKHVNRVLDVGRTAAGVPYLVLEYLEGCDLGGYLERRGALPISEAVDYVLQACEALAEAHAIGIVHRDMKPENLFLAEEADGGFVLKVLDFGISKPPAGRRGERSLTNPFEVVGSPTYMSPEQVRGGNVDARTDVWALGVVLHELCTSSIFFEEESLTATFKRVLDPQDLPPAIAEGEDAARVHEIIARCLEREPERRFQDMVELAQALSPLGTDSLQAARVAKVAAAARARFIALKSSAETPLVGTPLALTTSRVDLALLTSARPATQKRRLRTWSVVAAAAIAATVGGARQWTNRPGSEAHVVTSAAAQAPKSLEEAAPAEEAVVTAPPPTAAVALSRAPLPPAVLVPPRPVFVPPRPVFVPPRPVPVQAPLANAAPTSPASEASPSPEEGPAGELAHEEAAPASAEPTAHLEAAQPAPDVETAPSHGSFDAWDPNTFGGRK
ncbi:MAG: serine/threonine protein kinase [Myxococcales bacterium]|nr:MAG: serine/threonine protein kinase [Myxococcales bacterium]